jgi:hypothetical protein
MVIGKIGGYLALGLVGAFLLNTLIRPGSASATGGALQDTGAGIASIGSGIGESLQAIGEGASKLFNPLFTLRDLIYTTNASTAAGVGPVQQSQVLGYWDGAIFRQGSNPNAATITASNASDSPFPTSTPTGASGGANLSSLGAQRATGGGFGAAN